MSYSYYITPDEYAEAEKNGIHPKLLEQRVRKFGWNKERAITEKPQEKKDIKAWALVAKKNGIGYGTFRSRMYKYKMSIEEAATKPLLDKRVIAHKARESKRVFPKEIIHLLNASGISYNTFYSRVMRGWDMKEAATSLPIKAR